MEIGDLVVSTHQLDPGWTLTGEVVATKGKLVEVRITSAVRHNDGAAADPNDPWRKVGAVQRSAAFLWRQQ